MYILSAAFGESLHSVTPIQLSVSKERCDCLDVLYTPNTLNPALGGIGVDTEAHSVFVRITGTRQEGLLVLFDAVRIYRRNINCASVAGLVCTWHNE